MNRLSRLLSILQWNQPAMARYLRCGQSTVSRLALGQGEPGPVSKLLDLLEADIAAGRFGPAAQARLAARALDAAGLETGDVLHG